jgi:ADP-ribosylglycohydrolase
LTSPDDYWKTIETALWPGGDVDTIAAMAGAISGARNGLEGIPDVVTAKLNDKGKWNAAELSQLAERLYEAVYE